MIYGNKTIIIKHHILQHHILELPISGWRLPRLLRGGAVFSSLGR